WAWPRQRTPCWTRAAVSTATLHLKALVRSAPTVSRPWLPQMTALRSPRIFTMASPNSVLLQRVAVAQDLHHCFAELGAVAGHERHDRHRAAGVGDHVDQDGLDRLAEHAEGVGVDRLGVGDGVDVRTAAVDHQVDSCLRGWLALSFDRRPSVSSTTMSPAAIWSYSRLAGVIAIRPAAGTRTLMFPWVLKFSPYCAERRRRAARHPGAESGGGGGGAGRL